MLCAFTIWAIPPPGDHHKHTNLVLFNTLCTVHNVTFVPRYILLKKNSSLAVQWLGIQCKNYKRPPRPFLMVYRLATFRDLLKTSNQLFLVSSQYSLKISKKNSCRTFAISREHGLVYKNMGFMGQFTKIWDIMGHYGTLFRNIGFMGQVRGLQRGKKTNLDLPEQDTVSGSGISWAICKSAPRPRQITMSETHHSVFHRPDAFLAAQPTASKHWRQNK